MKTTLAPSSQLRATSADIPRRVALQNLAATCAASWVLSRCEKNAAPAGTIPACMGNPAVAGRILGFAIQAEQDLIQSYLTVASLANLQAMTSVSQVAGAFLAHHQAHFAALTTLLGQLRTTYPGSGIPVP